jgi:hypothetical protein
MAWRMEIMMEMEIMREMERGDTEIAKGMETER